MLSAVPEGSGRQPCDDLTDQCDEEVHGKGCPDYESGLTIAPDFCKAVVEDVRNRENDHCARQCDATDSEYFGSEEVGCDEAY